MPRALAFLLLAAVLAQGVILADQDPPWPRCGPSLDGQTLCAQGSLCMCRFDSGGVLSDTVAAWRWSCDMLKMCGPQEPAGIEPPGLPPGFGYSPQMSAGPSKSYKAEAPKPRP